MTAREIIINLLDKRLISGEEAIILIEATRPQIIYQPYYYDSRPWWQNTWKVSDGMTTMDVPGDITANDEKSTFSTDSIADRFKFFNEI